MLATSIAWRRLLDDEDRAEAGERASRRLAARQHGQLPLDLAGHRLRERRADRDAHGRGLVVVLGLRQQIGGDPLGASGAVGHDQHLARRREVVDADPPEHQALGGLHVDVAGTDDLVDARQRLGAEGERRHRLRAADAEEAIDAGDRRRGEHGAVASLHRSRRRYRDHLRDARDLGRDDVHEHGRRVGCAASRHVHADALERLDLLTEHEPRSIAVSPTPLQLTTVEVPDAARRDTRARDAPPGRSTLRRERARLARLPCGR